VLIPAFLLAQGRVGECLRGQVFAEGGGNGGSRAFSVGNVEQGTELSGVKTRRNDDAFVFAGFHNAVKTMHTVAGG